MFTTILLVVGLLFLLAGLVSVLLAGGAAPQAPAAAPPGQQEGLLEDIRQTIEAYNTFLGNFQQQLKIGVFLISVGLALVDIAAYFKAQDAKDQSDKAAQPTAIVVRVA